MLVADDVLLTPGAVERLRAAFARVPGLGAAFPAVACAPGGEGARDAAYTDLALMRALAERRAHQRARESEPIDGPARRSSRWRARRCGRWAGSTRPTARPGAASPTWSLRLRAAGYAVVRCDDAFAHRFALEASHNPAALADRHDGGLAAPTLAAAIGARLRSRRASAVRRAAPAAAPAVLAGTAIALAVGGAEELERAAVFLAAAARAFDAAAPVRVHLLLDGSVEPAAVAARVRPVLAAGGRPLDETLAVRIERAADLAAWRGALDPAVRAGGRRRPRPAGAGRARHRRAARAARPPRRWPAMRTHRTHQVLAPWSTGTPVLDPARLAALRVEPVLRQRRPAFALDFYLAGADGGDTVMPGVLVEPAVVVERDRDPLIWPHGTPGDDAFARALAERVLPHLERLVLGGERAAEHVVRFAPAPRFEAARAAGCYGAAPLREALVRLAPYRYARRFARGRSVHIDAPDAVGGWLLLRDLGLVTVAAARRDPAALAWYGDAPPAADDGLPPDVAIVEPRATATARPACCGWTPTADGGSTVVDPLPLDIGTCFDPAAGPARRWFAVAAAPEPAPRAPREPASPATGGSAGRIAVVLGRADGLSQPDADTDEARALVAALAAEGFETRLAAGPDDLAGADLIHLVGTREGRRARLVVEAGRRAGTPVAVHAHDEDAASRGWWGAAVTRYCFEYGADERDLRGYLDLLAHGAVSIGAARSDAPYAPASAAPDEAASALRDAAVVFAASEAEAAAIRRRTGRRGPLVVVPPLAALAAPAPVGALVGADPFALVHGPIGPLGNQLPLARCAADAGIPLVVSGPVADASYLERVQEFGGADLIVLPGEPSAALAAGLRAAAAVVVDPAWVGAGGSRLAAAALAGARLAVAERRAFTVPGAAVRGFDPADTAALTRALGEAWDDALRAPGRIAAETVAALAPAAALRAIVRGYAALAAVPA